jgi:hypothetical protein
VKDNWVVPNGKTLCPSFKGESNMSKEQKRIFRPLLVVVLVISGALVFVGARTRNGAERKASSHSTPVANRLNAAQSPPSLQVDRVRRGQLSPQLRLNLKALGDRLERPGRERLTLTGTLVLRGNPQTVPFVVILQFPDQLRLTMQLGVQTRVITYDGNVSEAVGTLPDSREQDLVESIVHDTAEHFFKAQMQGLATRPLGSRFRLDDGTPTNYTGGFYDVYEIPDQVRVAPIGRLQTKLYFFNSDNHLLERVRYELNRGGTQTAVEIRLSDWRENDGQHVPIRIVRTENEQTTLTLTITSVTSSPKMADAIFGTN